MRYHPSAKNLSEPLLEGGKMEAGEKETSQKTSAVSNSQDEQSKQPNAEPETPAELQPSHDQTVKQFKDLLEEHRKRTEYNLPHTIMQVEDVMFVREDRIIALEYIYYNKQDKYLPILDKKPQNQREFNSHISEKFSQEDNKSEFYKSQPTRLEDGQCQQGHDPNDRDIMDSYQPNPVELFPYLKEDYIKMHTDVDLKNMHTDADQKKNQKHSRNRQAKYSAHQDRQNKIKFIKLIGEAKEKVALLEPLVSIWKVSKEGNLSKIKEESFNMPQNITISNGQQMMFSLSFDQKIVSLTHFNENRELCIVAWNVDKLDTLERIQIDENLAEALKKALGPQDELVQLQYLQGEEYLQLVCKKEIAAAKDSKSQPRELVYTLFKKDEKKDGHVEIQFRTKSDGSFENLHCLAMMPKHVDCEDSIILNKDDLRFLFLYVDTSQTDKQQNFKVFKIELTFKELMSQPRENNLKSILSDMLKQSKQSFQELSGIILPIRWFRQERNYHDQISIGTTHNCNSFGFLNHKEQLYLAFQGTNKKNGKEILYEKIGTQHIPEMSLPSIVRNQSTKPFLCLIVRIKDDGSTAFCFHSKEFKKQIKMNDDHDNASQDIILQTYRLHESYEPKSSDEQTQSDVSPKKKKPALGHGCQHFDHCRLQSCSISKGDQSVLLKTSGILDKRGEQQVSLSNQLTHRKSFNQRHQGNFPIFAYNLGQRKLIIQNSLRGDKATYIYELPSDELFLNFIEYNEVCDLGFFPRTKQPDMSSNFAFLTESRESRKMHVNILQVNPYQKCTDGAQPQPTFKVFKSTRYFEVPFSERDIIMKSIMYHTKKRDDMSYDFKIVFQYSCSFKILKFKMPDEEFYSDILSEGLSTYSSLDHDNTIGNLEQVFLALNDKGLIFYVQNMDQSCQIKMIDPRNDEIAKHLIVLELQTKSCRHFSVSQDSVFFIDDQHNIYKFKWNHETLMLKQVDQLQVRDKDKPHLCIKAFDKIIIRDDFLISQSKIFYINASEPYTDDILKMENLKDEENQCSPSDIQPKDQSQQRLAGATVQNHSKHYTDGPFEMRGSKQFIMVYRYCKDNQIKQKVYQLPDSTSTTLINETKKSVNFSTFIKINKTPIILVNIGEEYLIFNKDGKFKSLVLFNRKIDSKSPENKAQPSLQLITMSNNGKNFLFLNCGNNDLEIYTLTTQQTGTQIQTTDSEPDQQEQEPSSDDSISLKSNASTRLKRQICVSKTKMFRHYKSYDLEFRLQSLIKASNIDDDKAKYDSFIKQIEDNVIDCHIDRKGRVTFIKVKLNDGCSQDNNCWADTESFIDLDIIQSDQPESKSKMAFQSFNLHKKNLQNKDYLILSKKEQEELKNEAQQKKQESVQEQLYHSLKSQVNLLYHSFKSQVKCYKFDWYSDQPNKKETLLIITCGDQVFFQIFKSDKQANKKGLSTDDKLELEKMNIEFDEKIEFKSFLETEQALTVQMTAEDKNNNIFMVITWDFDKNIEKSMYQVDSKDKPNLDAQLVRGLNQKMNYFIDEDFVTDLESIIPIHKTIPHEYYRRKRGLMKHLTKIFQDNSRYLSNREHQNVLVFQTSRISLKYWSDFAQMGFEIKEMKNNFKFKHFQTILKNQSLFHFFANNQDLFTVIHQKFKDEQNEAKRHDEKELNNTPLLMLYSYNDGKTEVKTALEMALDASRPKVFLQMLELLEPLDHRMLTHLMIKQLPFIIRSCNQLHLKYLDSACYQSLTMLRTPLVIDWPSKTQQICFTSHTSMITAKDAKSQIENFISEQRFFPKCCYQCCKCCKKDFPEISGKQNQIPLNFNEKTTTATDVKVEVLDFNFIFENNNTELFLMLLAEQKDSDVLDQTSIRCFIGVVWQKFYYLIRNYIFIPYIVYMLFFVGYASEFAGEYNDLQYLAIHREENLDDPQHFKNWFDNHILPFDQKYKIWRGIIKFLTVFNILTGFYFLRVEIKQFRQFLKFGGSVFGYFTDPWNHFDWISIAINMVFVFYVTENLMQEKEAEQAIRTVHIRFFGSIACFFMWLKTFYWMRLFKQTAPFVALIINTVRELKIFGLMFLLCIFGFANFFYIQNNNTSFNKNNSREHFQESHPDEEFYSEDEYEEFRYVPKYTKIPVIDSIIYVYLLSLGDLNYDDLNKGDSVKLNFFILVLATILVYIIFMNVIIAIVNDVFATLQTKKMETDIEEKIEMIRDFMWLKDFEKIFEGQKYIVRLSPDNSSQEKETDFLEEVKQQFNHQQQRLDEIKQEIMKLSRKQTKTMALLT